MVQLENILFLNLPTKGQQFQVIEMIVISVEIGFYAYRKGNKFYGNLDASVAIMFEDEYKGQLIEFECKYIKSKDQLKLTTSKNVVFYLKRIE